MAPIVLQGNHADVVFTDENTSCVAETADLVLEDCKFGEILSELKPFAMHFDSVFAEADVYLESSPDIMPGEEKRITVVIRSKIRGFNESAYNLSMPNFLYKRENRCVLEITASGRFMPMYIPILFLG